MEASGTYGRVAVRPRPGVEVVSPTPKSLVVHDYAMLSHVTRLDSLANINGKAERDCVKGLQNMSFLTG